MEGSGVEAKKMFLSSSGVTRNMRCGGNERGVYKGKSKKTFKRLKFDTYFLHTLLLFINKSIISQKNLFFDNV